MLEELLGKADQVEETQTPEKIADMVRALRAFVDDEIAESEVVEEEEGDPMTEATEAAEADDYMAYSNGEDDSDTRAKAAEADAYSKYAVEDPEADPVVEAAEAGDGEEEEYEDDEGELDEADGDPEDPAADDDEDNDHQMECRNCGHQMEMGGYPMTEGYEPEEGEEEEVPLPRNQQEAVAMLNEYGARLQEAHGQLQAAANNQQELAELRRREAFRQKRARAIKAIRESNAEGLISTKELAPFHEAQWPFMLRQAVNNAPSPAYTASSLGAGGNSLREAGRQPTRAKSAVDLWDQLQSPIGNGLI